CQSHLLEGIHDPIKAYEYRGHYYVMEGHKRVSVLRYFGALSVRGFVIRMIPALGSSPEDRQYAAFLYFYRLTGITYLWFRKASDYAALLRAVRKSSSDIWTEEERRRFRAFYPSFYHVYHENGSLKMICPPMKPCWFIWTSMITNPRWKKPYPSCARKSAVCGMNFIIKVKMRTSI